MKWEKSHYFCSYVWCECYYCVLVIIDNYTPYFLQFIYTYNLDIENTQRNVCHYAFLLMIYFPIVFF